MLDVRKKQLDDKMEENKRRQQESIESREELLRELEEVQRMTAREKVEEERQRREREEEIQAQVGMTVIFLFSLPLLFLSQGANFESTLGSSVFLRHHIENPGACIASQARHSGAMRSHGSNG